MKNVKEYFKPATVQEAVTLLQQHPGNAACIAGGTHIAVVKDPSIEYLVDITYCGLNAIRREERDIRIGACVTLEELQQSDVVRGIANGILADVACWTGSVQRRNSATVGGSLVLQQDIVLPLLALDAQLVIMGTAERIIPLTEFYTNSGIALQPGEIITECRIPTDFQNACGAVQRQSRTRQDVTITAVATVVTIADNICQNVRIATTPMKSDVSPMKSDDSPMKSGIRRVSAAEQQLQGQPATPDTIAKTVAALMQEIDPVDDHRASADYRRKVLGVYTRRALEQCFGL